MRLTATYTAARPGGVALGDTKDVHVLPTLLRAGRAAALGGPQNRSRGSKPVQDPSGNVMTLLYNLFRV